LEKTSVGLKADLPESREVTQPFAEVEVTGVIDGGFGARPDLGDAGDLLKVLLEARAFVGTTLRPANAIPGTSCPSSALAV